MHEQKIIELEIKVAYQEDLLQALNKTVAQLQHQISLLERTCQLLHEQISSFRHDQGGAVSDQPPPHY